MSWWRSLRVQGLALLAVLVALPLLVLAVLGDADDERRALLMAAVAEAGQAIGTGLSDDLETLAPADIERLPEALFRFAGPQRSIRVLLRPTGAPADGFFLLAAAPPVADVEAERRMLLALGTLPTAAESCTAPSARPALLSGGEEVLTAIVTVAGRAGCWAVVIGTDAARLRGLADPAPYWQRPEARAALLIYGLMAGLIALIFAGVWLSLRRMQRLARDGAEPAFAGATDVPELSGLAAAFDAMVLRLRRSAEMLRQAAEANAHAFKGPIGTIRQALHGQSAPPAVEAALNRLDGLVQSARVLDSAAAELLEPELERIDLSALATAVVAGLSASHPGAIAADIAPGIAVRATDDALETVLENLVENAIGFAPAGRPVRVALRREAEAVLTVEDDGPGVPPDRLERIFERYYSHRPSTGPGATPGAHFGIGLWLVRQHVLLLGGSIVAANRAEGGLRMTVRLPLG